MVLKELSWAKGLIFHAFYEDFAAQVPWDRAATSERPEAVDGGTGEA